MDKKDAPAKRWTPTILVPIITPLLLTSGFSVSFPASSSPFIPIRGGEKCRQILSIHILDKGATEQDYKDLSRNTLGSKYFGGLGCISLSEGRQDEVYDHFSKSSQVWVGSVSWLKAGITEDKETYIPDIVNEIHGIIGEDFPVINEELIEKIEMAYDKCVNKTSYDVEKKQKVIDFLKEHKGEKACTISW